MNINTPPTAFRPLLLAAIITSTLALSACGSSSSSSSSNNSSSNNAPVANAGVDQTITTGSAVSLNGSGSSDADGDALTYVWRLTAQPAASSSTITNATSATPVFTPDVAGSYTISMTVSDGTDSRTDQVIVTATTVAPTVNTAPSANAGVDQSVNVGSSVTLNAGGSSDVDNDTLTYTWAIVNLPAGSTAVLSSSSVVNPSFTPDMAGSYTFQVSVSDGTEASTDQVTVTASTATVNGSTAGVLCDFNQSIFNDSASVNATSTASWTCEDGLRSLVANGIPDHSIIKDFPNPANPNTITEQVVADSFTLTPTETGTATGLGGPAGVTGFMLNGIKIDAGTGGSCDDSGTVCSLGDPSGGWSIEALTQGYFDFGADENNAHVQPGGAYHYHGMPEGLVTLRGGNSSTMTLIGWAADGFPIYARYGYSDANDAGSDLENMTSSYQLVSNVSTNRPSVDTYALGTFLQDWEYVAGSGDLDECNGRFGVTPEFPNGIYHYFATDMYPFLQRCVTGEVEAAGGGAGGPPGGVPPM